MLGKKKPKTKKGRERNDQRQTKQRRGFDLDKLRAFYTALEAGTISKGADWLNITQPALSRTISMLEDSLGTVLFYRFQRRGLVPTKHGEILFEYAKEILTKATEATNRIYADMEENIGEIRIVTTTSTSAMWLPEILAEFALQYPEIELTVMGRTNLVDIIRGEADVIIWPAVPDDEELIYKEITTFHLNLYASPEYLKKYGEPKTIEDLKHHKLLAFGQRQKSYNFNVDWPFELLDEPWKPYLKLDNRRGLYRLAEKGYGIVAMAEEFYKKEPLNLQLILPDFKGPTTPLYFITTKEIEKLRKVNTLYHFLKEKSR